MTEAVTSRPGHGPVLNIVGELIALGPMQRELVPLYQRWINDFEAARNLGVPRPLTEDQELAWFTRVSANSDEFHFTIFERASGRPIGNTGLHHVDLRNRTAMFGILIGEADCRGRGYGTEATRLMLDYAFTALGLHSLLLTVHEFNLAGQRAYHKAGYREMGRRRQSLFMGGRWWDQIYMDCLASEFTSPVLHRVLAPDRPQAGGGSA